MYNNACMNINWLTSCGYIVMKLASLLYLNLSHCSLPFLQHNIIIIVTKILFLDAIVVHIRMKPG